MRFQTPFAVSSRNALRGAAVSVALIMLACAPARAQIAADQKACADKKGDEAIEACTRVIESKDNKKIKLEHVYFNRGIEWSAKKDYDKAIADYTAAIKLDPKYADAYHSRGGAHRGKGSFDLAIADYSEAIKLNATRGLYYRNRANAYSSRRSYELALNDFNVALKLNAEDASANDGAAWIMATAPDSKLRNGKRAVELATKACELSQWKRATYVDTLAAAYAEDGNYAEAVRRQEQALADADFDKAEGKNARTRLKLYKSKKPVRLPK